MTSVSHLHAAQKQSGSFSGWAMQIAVGLAVLTTTTNLSVCLAETIGVSAESRVAVAVKPEGPLVFARSDDPSLADQVRGQVVNEEGDPVPGAEIFVVAKHPNKRQVDATGAANHSLYGIPDSVQLRPLKSVGPVRATTDSDGRFEFTAPDITYVRPDGLPARESIVVFAAADEYGVDWERVNRRKSFYRYVESMDAVDQALNLTFTLPKADVPIQGRVLDDAGEPVGNALVRVTSVMIPRNRDLDVYLEKANRQSRPTNPIQGEDELAVSTEIPSTVTETITDPDGRFTITGFGRDQIVGLQVTSDRTVKSRFSAVTRVSPSERPLWPKDSEPKPGLWAHYPASFTAYVFRGKTLAGRVVDKNSREPVSGMWVGTHRSSWSRIRDGIHTIRATTDSDGRFRIAGLHPLYSGFDTVVAMSPPGDVYWPGVASVDPAAKALDDVLIKVERMIPFQLRVVDEDSNPIEADVEYVDVRPNPHVPRGHVTPNPNRISLGAPDGRGVYRGFVMPGPGAILVKTPGHPFQAARVDPRTFFEPERTDWSEAVSYSSYGSLDVLHTSRGLIRQTDYAAIVLVNPPVESASVELTATVYDDHPRRVSLVDEDRQPVAGLYTEGMTEYSADVEPWIRTSTIHLTGLHPERTRSIRFFNPARSLIGFLKADGTSQEPYRVTMRASAMLVGQLIDSDGRPMKEKSVRIEAGSEPAVLKEDDWLDDEGRFTIDRLVPGIRYEIKMTTRGSSKRWRTAKSFSVTLKPGERRDLGAITLDSASKD